MGRYRLCTRLSSRHALSFLILLFLIIITSIIIIIVIIVVIITIFSIFVLTSISLFFFFCFVIMKTIMKSVSTYFVIGNTCERGNIAKVVVTRVHLIVTPTMESQLVCVIEIGRVIAVEFSVVTC